MDFSSSLSQKATFVGLQQETKDYLSGLLSLSLSLSLFLSQRSRDSRLLGVGRKTVLLFFLVITENYLSTLACHESFKESLNRKPFITIFFFFEQGFNEAIAMYSKAKQMQQCSSLVQQQLPSK
jgi:hypothetical protein